MSVKIKNFGRNSVVNCAMELKNALKNEYKNKSIVIVTKLKSGLDKSNFVDIDSDGNITGSFDNTAI